MSAYPAAGAARDRFILDRRPGRPEHDPWRHHGAIAEEERAADGRVARGATVFLTGRECPWRCAMCDLWQFTIAGDTPRGAIPAQIAAARDELRARGESITQIKLYNAGSFFDPRAVPEADYDDVAARVDVPLVIVESHPSLVGARVDRFLESLARRSASGAPARLEVAMGLETAHPEALERLNKQMTVDAFRRAADRLRQRAVAVRAFVLLFPPFIRPAEQDAWLLRSIDVAFSCGASVVSLIPTRPGNGTLDALVSGQAFRQPRLEDIERGVESALAAHGDRGRIFIDLWDLQRFARCPHCFEARRARLHALNLNQQLLAPAACPAPCADTPS